MMALMIDIDCCSQLELAMCGLKCCLSCHLVSSILHGFHDFIENQIRVVSLAIKVNTDAN
jgi:hypothetical protein